MVGPILIDHLIERPKWEESDLLIGHLGLLPLEYKFDYFTVLRDPLERLYSYYSHVKRDSFHYHHKIVDGERLDFLGYLLDERFYNINFNMKTRYLSTKLRIDSSDTEKTFDQKAYEYENSPHTNVKLELALRTLDNASWVGNSSSLNQLGRFLEMKARKKAFNIATEFSLLNASYARVEEEKVIKSVIGSYKTKLDTFKGLAEKKKVDTTNYILNRRQNIIIDVSKKTDTDIREHMSGFKAELNEYKEKQLLNNIKAIDKKISTEIPKFNKFFKKFKRDTESFKKLVNKLSEGELANFQATIQADKIKYDSLVVHK
jgi:gas vesicle protein